MKEPEHRLGANTVHQKDGLSDHVSGDRIASASLPVADSANQGGIAPLPKGSTVNDGGAALPPRVSCDKQTDYASHVLKGSKLNPNAKEFQSRVAVDFLP